MADDGDMSEIGGDEWDGIQNVTLERVKDLERTLKNKELDHQELMIENKGKLNDLELDNRSKDKNIETLSKKLKDLMEEN